MAGNQNFTTVNNPLNLSGMNSWATITTNRSEVTANGMNSNITINNNQGTVRLMGMNTTVNVDTNNGQIIVGGTNNSIRVGQNNSGCIITATGVNCRVQISRNSGDINLSGVNCNVQVDTDTQQGTLRNNGVNCQVYGNCRVANPPPSPSQYSTPNQNPNFQQYSMSSPFGQNISITTSGNAPGVSFGWMNPSGFSMNLWSGGNGQTQVFTQSSGPGFTMAPNHFQTFTFPNQLQPPPFLNNPSNNPQANDDSDEEEPNNQTSIRNNRRQKVPIDRVQCDPNSRLQEQCSICHETVYKKEADNAYLPCLHWYHLGCIKAWIQRSGNCPVCKHVPEVIYATAIPPNR